jgi:tetratricopeptide (TPR) repeat protein
MLKPMRVPALILTSLVVVLVVSPSQMRAQGPDQVSDRVSDQAEIVRAYDLWTAGDARAAVAILEPLLQPVPRSFAESDLGVGWEILASAYQDLEMYDKARQAYTHAIEKLRALPSQQAQYAATVDNFATLEDALGQRTAAKLLCMKARHIYEAIGDRSGMEITSIDLALIAYGQKDFKTARRAVAEALEEQHAVGISGENLAALDSVKSALALHDGKVEEAISAIDQAIDLWMHIHGADYVQLGTAYLQCAQAFAKRKDYLRAAADAQHGLAIAEASVGKKTLAYATAESIYAQILRESGERDEASRLKEDASRTLASLRLRQCYGCTIDASAFR